jgi:transcriptional regulator NrdR family protein
MGLRRDLMLAASKRDTVDLDTFVEQIVGSVEGFMDTKAEKDLEKAVNKVAKMFPAGKRNDEVDYQQFLEVYARYEELFKT